ncbi:MAG: UDP-glucose/GDP-mannose dehydrogenase family protein [Patescibacteria group bacterium]
MQLTVIGTGFVGVVTAAVFADKGHTVYGLDIDKQKVASLQKGQVPFYEPELKELLVNTQKSDNLHFTTDYQTAIPGSRVIFVAVGTPSSADGGVDLRFIEAAVTETAKHMSPGAILVIKSTVPPGTFDRIAKIITKATKVPYALVSMPEFLREGSAVYDTQHPDRIVIGATDEDAIAVLKTLHQQYEAPIEVVSPESAQMGKYASNAYLANRITFINHVADVCEKNNADVMEVIRVMGRDARIGNHYWYPGPGYGGSCFPKDVKELAHYSKKVGLTDNMFVALTDWNQARIPQLMTQFSTKVGGWKNKSVAVLGLSFKPNTDDIREAPALQIIPELLAEGARVVAYDPKATAAFQQIFASTEQLAYAKSVAEAVKGADVIMSVIEWPEITDFEYKNTDQSKKVWFIDWRNQSSQKKITDTGFSYIGIGKGA